jgi:nitrite reductase/ring-hydroxylating ferredoxin subunit
MNQSGLNLLKSFIFFLLFFSLSCDEINKSPVPYVSVNLIINLNIVNELNVPGNSVYFANAGYRGVIVCCEYPGSYYAFDAACTNDINSDCRVRNEGMIGECPCCGSRFILLNNGYPGDGPATIPLKQYNVSVINSFELRVYN